MGKRIMFLGKFLFFVLTILAGACGFASVSSAEETGAGEVESIQVEWMRY